MQASFKHGSCFGELCCKTGLHYSVGSYIKLSGIHGGWCWFDINISIGTHQIFINLISVQRGGIYLSDDVKKLQKFGILICFYDFQNLRDPRKYCFYHPGLMGGDVGST